MIRDILKRLRRGLMEQGQTMTQKTVRGLVWVGASNVCLNLLEVARTLILVRLLSPLDFGIVRIGIIAASYARVLTTTGISKALVQAKEMDRELIDTAWVIEIARNLLQCLALFLLAPLIARYFKQEAVTLMLRVFALRYVFSAFRNPATQLLIRDLNFRRHEIFERSYNLMGFAVTIVAAIILRNYWALVIGQLFLALADLVGSYLMYPYMPRFRFNRVRARQIIKFGKHLYISAILGNTAATIDGILLGRILGVSELGIYSLAKNFAARPGRFLVQVVEPVLFPAISRLQSNLGDVRRAYLRIVAMLSLVRMPVYAGLALIAPLLLPMLLPEAYLDGIPVFMLFCAGSVIALPVNPILQGIGKPHLTWFRSLIMCAVAIPAVLILGSRYQMIGVAWTKPLLSIVALTISVSMIRRALKLKLSNLLKAISRPFLAAAVMTAVLVPVVVKLAQPTILWLAGVSLAGAAIYGIITLTTNRNALDEIKTMGRSLMGSRKPKETD